MSLAPYILIPEATYSGNQLSQSQIDNVDSIPYLQANINSATPNNTANTIVKRDSVGSFSSNAISSSLLSTNSVESLGSILSLGNNSSTQSINIGCGTGIQNINLGTTSGNTTINLGGIGDSVVVQGDLVTVNTTNLGVQDKNIILNMSGSAASGFGAGIQVMEGGNTGAGYIQVSSDRTAWALKPPAGSLISLNQSLLTSDTPSFASITCPGTITAGNGYVSNTLAFPSTVTRKRVSVFDIGNPNSTSDHRFSGFGITNSTLVYQANNTGDSHVFFAATSATTSNELFRISGLGAVSCGGSFTAGRVLPQSTIAFPNVETRKRLTLWDAGDPNSVTDHRFNGLGKDASMMIFQVNASTDDHVFFAATSASTSTELFRIKGSGSVSCPGPFTVNGTGTFSSGVAITGNVSVAMGTVNCQNGVSCSALTTPYVIFPSGTLSNFEEYDHTSIFNLQSIASSSVTVRFSRIGRKVTAHVPQVAMTNAATLTQGPLISATAFPTRFRGSSPCLAYVSVNNDSTSPAMTSGCVNVSSDGFFIIYPTTPASIFSVNGAYNFGFASFSVTWTV